MRFTQKRYLQIFGLSIITLGIVRQINSCQPQHHEEEKNINKQELATNSETADSALLMTDFDNTDIEQTNTQGYKKTSRFFNADGTPVKSRIYSVPNFGDAFPDQNDVQLIAARRHGVKAVVNRTDAERRKSELVYVGSNPFYHVDKLKSSIPYLVPRAAELLQDIGSTFYDSLQVKHIPLHKIIVTSILRSKEDVEKLRSHNGNATENSCHLYGTTFDICYNRYHTVQPPEGPARRAVRNDTLKWVLSEVLNDMRQAKRCYIKYEIKQGCFHITVN